MVAEFSKIVLFHPSIHPVMKNCYCYVHPLNLCIGQILCIGIIYEYGVHIVHLIKMKVLTYTLCKEHCELYTEIHGSNAVNSCQTEIAEKDIILLSNVSIIVHKAGKRTDVENNTFIHFNLSVGTYSTDSFNAKIKVAILQKRQD